MLYGAGVFSTVAIASGQPVLWEKHWKRLASNAEKLGIEISEFSSDAVLDRVMNEVRANRLELGRARITFHDERPAELWRSKDDLKGGTTLSIIVGETRPLPGKLRLSYSPFPINSRSALAGIKSCNYLEPQLSLNEARIRGFHEAIRLNENRIVTGACMANVFWLRDGGLFTPALATGRLAGTTREYILENLACEEVEAGSGDLDTAEAIFLTSARLCIAQVAEFESRKLSTKHHPILDINGLFGRSAAFS